MGAKGAGCSPCRQGLYRHPQQGSLLVGTCHGCRHEHWPLWCHHWRPGTSTHSPAPYNGMGRNAGAEHRSQTPWNLPRERSETQARRLPARWRVAFLSPCRYHSISEDGEGEKQAAIDAGWLKASHRCPTLALKYGAPSSSFVPGSESLLHFLLLVALPGRTFGAQTYSLVGVDSSAAQRCGAAVAGRKLPHWFCQESRAIMEWHLAVFANKHCLPSCLTPSATQTNFPPPPPPPKMTARDNAKKQLLR